MSEKSSSSGIAMEQGENPAAQQVVPPIQIHDMTIAYHKKPVLWDVAEQRRGD